MREDERCSDELARPVAASFDLPGIQKFDILTDFWRRIVAVGRMQVACLVQGTFIWAEPNAPFDITEIGAGHANQLDAGGMKEHFGDIAGYEKAFAGAPQTSVWQTPVGGVWSEW